MMILDNGGTNLSTRLPKISSFDLLFQVFIPTFFLIGRLKQSETW